MWADGVDDACSAAVLRTKNGEAFTQSVNLFDLPWEKLLASTQAVVTVGILMCIRRGASRLEHRIDLVLRAPSLRLAVLTVGEEGRGDEGEHGREEGGGWCHGYARD